MMSSMGVGFMAVFAVSGSVVLLVHQVHKRLLSDFMKKFESEFGTILYSNGKKKFKGSEKYQSKKKVRFADDVEEPSSNNEEYRKRHLLKVKQVLAMKNVTYLGNDHKLERTMPANRQALYKGIIENRTRRE
ncbi:hypothetical protein FCV25MIE_09628 [Fagus crenata]